MAYDKSSSGCTPITAKIKRTTKGGVVQPLLNMGAPVKMKASSPAKNTTARQKANESRIKARKSSEAAKAAASEAKKLKKAKELSSKEFVTNKRGRKVKNPKYQAPSVQPVNDKKSSNKSVKDISKKSSGASMTPYSVKDGKGVIHGPKVSYDMAYKNRDMKTYGGMNKAEYIKEAKRQTKSFESTGKFDAPKPRKKQKTISVSTKAAGPASTTAKPTASVEISVKAPKVTNEKAAKRSARKTSRAQKTRKKGIEALESGNLAKARRLQRREARLTKRAAKQADKAIEPKKSSAAKQTAKQQQQKEKREKALAKAKFIKKAEKKGNLKELKKNPPKVKRVYK